MQLCEAICQMEVGEVLKSVEDEYCEEFYRYYLHDFVRIAHNSQHKSPEQEEEEYNVSTSGEATVKVQLDAYVSNTITVTLEKYI